ncbi:sigma-70 family RNA polymerase sigma factor [Acutalibacter sp. 1XD8-33]|uniref:sigma-70 family RNA polymerase sigma factor n=1 Tax=Acutalibacter sp. 1XD8-33 TaxID=2320081 RepID=UPI000EA2E3B2|nr:sigma-70 family RNA polymerase sigma factor [Acutalibacter sp. 1XD8-33]RKJ40045.1 sigma-70 family RNA polymerase sigma factor [Acutalibacter sp. 1XD8-33]
MRTKLVSLDEIRNFFGREDSLGPDQGRGIDRRSAKAVLQLAIERDLTDRQRECVRLYFFDGLTMEEAGQALGVNKATVYRHLQKALARLERALAYAAAIRRAEQEED